MDKYFTKEGLEKLKKELNYLENEKRREIAEKLKHAISFGDLKENAAYDEAKDAQGFLERRVLELKKFIADARIINQRKTGKVQIGSTVVLICGGEKEKFQIVGPEEADIAAGKISYQSPLGKAILGKSIGDKAVVNNAEGGVEYEILEIK